MTTTTTISAPRLVSVECNAIAIFLKLREEYAYNLEQYNAGIPIPSQVRNSFMIRSNNYLVISLRISRFRSFHSLNPN
jgi:hypothetical protein